jgi:hypothetical protein
MIVDKTKQAAERWSSSSKIKSLMAKHEDVENKIAAEVRKNLSLEESYCSKEDDIAYIIDYENTDEMDSVIKMSVKERVYYA